MAIGERSDLWHGLEYERVPSLADIEVRGQEVQASLDLSSGPLFRSVLFETDDGAQRLMLTVHHIVSDRLSLLVLLDQLDATLAELSAGRDAPELLPTVGFGSWIESLASWTSGDEAERVAAGWRSLQWADIRSIVESDLPNRNVDADGIRFRLGAEASAALLRNDHARAEELITIALGSAVAEFSDSSVALIETLSHGRRLAGLETSRTVGMFLNYAPVVVGRLDEPERVESAVAELRRQQETAWSFDVLRYYTPDEQLRDFLRSAPRAEVLLNFVGRSLGSDDSGFFAFDLSGHGSDTAPDGYRDHALAVMAEIDSEDTVELLIVFSKALHSSEQISRLGEQIVERLENLVAGTLKRRIDVDNG